MAQPDYLDLRPYADRRPVSAAWTYFYGPAPSPVCGAARRCLITATGGCTAPSGSPRQEAIARDKRYLIIDASHEPADCRPLAFAS